MEKNIKLLVKECSELDCINFIINNIIQNDKCLIYTRNTYNLNSILNIVKKRNEMENISIILKVYSRFIKNDEKDNIKKLFINGNIQCLICDDLINLDTEFKQINNIIYYDIPLNISKFYQQIKTFSNLKLCYIYLDEFKIKIIKKKKIDNIFLNQDKCYWKEILLYLEKNADFDKCNNCSNCITLDFNN